MGIALPYHRFTQIAALLLLVLFTIFTPVFGVCEPDAACSGDADVICDGYSDHESEGQEHGDCHHCPPDCIGCGFTVVFPDLPDSGTSPLPMIELAVTTDNQLPETALPPPDHPPRLLIS